MRRLPIPCRATLAGTLLLWLAGATATVIATGPASAAQAGPPEWQLSDYVHTVWTHHDGIPLSTPRRILQTTDGYLWIVTRDEGLLRFDGMRFVRVPLPCPHPIERAESTPDGGLWFLCDTQLFRRAAHGQIAEVRQVRLPPGPQAGLHVDRRGRLWVLLVGLLYLVEGEGQRVTEIYRHPERGIMAWAEDSEGTIWLSDTSNVIRVVDRTPEVLPVQGAYSLTRAPSGGVFAADSDRVWQLGPGASRPPVRAPPGVTFANLTNSMAAGADGALWIGTRQHGIAFMQDGRIEMLPDTSHAKSLVTTVLIDREESVWVGDTTGVHRFRKPRVRLMSSLAGHLGAGVPQYAFVDSRNDIWVGLKHATVFSPMSRLSREVQGDYQAAGEDSTGRIWLASETDLGYVKRDAFVPVRDRAMASVGHVFAIKKDDHGDLWALAPGVGLYRVTPGPPQLVVDAPNVAADFVVSSRHGAWVALEDGNVLQQVAGRTPIVHQTQAMSNDDDLQAIVEDGDAIWCGGRGGLLRWRHGAWTIWTRQHGLPGRGAVFEIAPDASGNLWLMTSGGIIALPRAPLDDTPDGAPRTLAFARMGELDRVVPHVGGMRSSPRVSADRRGLLYFTTLDSVAIVDPSTPSDSSLKPSVVIESLAADNQPVDLASTLRLIEPSRLQFEYTSLSLRSPENSRFRYKLEGYDRDWIEAGGERRVIYATLAPGRYRFRVIGSGSEGVWNEEGASVTFQIAPVWWHTWWFRGTALGLGALLLVAVHRVRMRRLTQQLNMRFEERLAERTRIAQELHDTLLQGMALASIEVQMASHELTADAPSHAAIDRALPSLTHARQALSTLIDESRATVKGLRIGPPAEDLADALYLVAREQLQHDDVAFHVTVDGAARPLHPRIRDDVGRIIREAIVNAYRHSHARHIRVTLAYTRTEFRCVVRDDGQGMDADVLHGGREGHWGLTGMRERAARVSATLQMRSTAGTGTEVELCIKRQHAFEPLATGRWRWFTNWFTGTPPRPS